MHRLPWIVAVAASATFLGGGLAAADQRGDASAAKAQRAVLAQERRAEQARLDAEQRKQEAEAAAAAVARAARTRWQAQLTPITASVMTHVQPLVTAFDGRGSRSTTFGPNVRDDVLAHGGSVAGLRALAPRLAAVRPPAAEKPEHAPLVRALGRLTSAAVALDAATRAKADRKGRVPAFTPAVKALDAAVDAWSAAMTDAFDGAREVPARGETPLATTRARGAYLQRVGDRCAVALQQIDKRFDPDPETFDETARNLVGLASVQSGALAQVLAVPRPATRAAAALPAAVTAHKRNLDALTRTLDPAQPIGAQAARVIPLLEALDATNSRAVSAFEAVGSGTCAQLADDV